MDLFTLSASIVLDTTEYEKALESASKENQKAANSIKTVGSASNTLRNQIGVLKGQYAEAQNEVKRLSDEFNKSAKETGLTSKETQELAKKLKEAQDKASGLKKELDETKGKATEFGNTLKNGVAAAAKIAAAAITAVTAAAAGFAASSVKTGMEFDSAMSQVSATMGMTVQDIQNNVNGAGDTFNALREKALEMGSTTKFTAQEAAEGLNILAMSGYNAEESMNMIEDVLHLAAAGSMDMASAAGYVSGAMKGFNDKTKDAAYYADLMAKGATLANTDVTQLGEAMSGGAAAAKSYGQSAETVTLALLRLAEQGEVGSAASTALAAAMKNLYAPTDQAKKLLLKLGVQAFEPSTGAARDFNDVVNELQVALSDYSDEQKAAYAQTIFGIQGFDAYNKMVVTSVEKQNEWASALAGATGEASRQYDTMTDNLTGDLDKFNSALDSVKIALTDRLTPALRDGTQFITGLAEAAQKFIEEGGIEQITETFQNLAPVIAAATAAFVAYKAASTISAIVEAVTQALNGQTTAFALLNAVMEANIFVKVATLIAAVGTALVTLYMTNEDFRNKVNAAWQSVKDTISGVVNAVVTFFTVTVPNAGREMLGFFKSIPDKAFQWGKDLIDNFVNGIKSKIQDVKDAVSNVASTVKDFLGFSEPEKGPLSNFHTYAPDMMQLFASGIRENAGLLKSAFDDSLDFGTKNVDFGTANVDFASSSVGRSSAAIINSVSGENKNVPIIPLTINLQTGDGMNLASWLLNDLIAVAKANGTPIAGQQYA